MSPRPRTIADADILGAAQRVISRIGPAKITLADVAREAGLSPATLVQRFGSKRALLLAVAEAGMNSVEACFLGARAANPGSPLGALVSAATEMTRFMKSPEELANGLAFLQIDVSDPDFHRLALENFRRQIEGYRALLDDAVRARELGPCDSRALARAVNALGGGSLISWAIMREGAAESWVRSDLETLLRPYRTKRRAPKPATKRKGRTAKR